MVNEMTTKKELKEFIEKRLVKSHTKIPEFEITYFSNNKKFRHTVHADVVFKTGLLFIDELTALHVQHVSPFGMNIITARIVAYPSEISGGA